MLSFESDYTTGAHPRVLEKLIETNLISQSGYGNDAYCASARERIRAACQCPEADVRFLVGGTQTNSTVIAMALMPYEGVISATTGHIAAHEAGAVEYTGHKVLTIPGHEGKIHADELIDYLRTFYADGSHDHMVQPGMVYISTPQNTVRSTPWLSWRRSPPSAVSIACPSLWTAPASATVLQACVLT